MFPIVILIFISILYKVQSNNEVPIVQTKFGAVSGVYEEDSVGSYYLYMGIPYGRPPKDILFGDPVDPEPWNGVYEANSDKAKCPQLAELYDTLVGNPDCLYLNVYAPANRTSTKPLSVLYWIYGGDNDMGYIDRIMWGPEFLIRHDVIMVIINYRLGPYGFMCLGTKEIPGNAGLKDVLKGLRWVRDNISGFGGNPKDVTIGGSSTGSSIVEFLIVSPAARGLFHRAIRQSGSKIVILNNMNYTSHEMVLTLAKYLGFKGDVQQSVEFLKHVNPLDVIGAVKKLDLHFKECIEPLFDGVEAFFTQGHTETMVNGNYSSVDTLMGVNCNENPYRGEINETTVVQKLDTALETFMVNDKDKVEVGKTFLHFYKGSKPLDKWVQVEMSKLFGDYNFVFFMYLSLQHMLRQKNKIYFYEFCYCGNRNYGKLVMKVNVDGAIHADEDGYLFKQGVWGDYIIPQDKLIIDRMTKMWTNFIKYGNPTPEVTELLPIKWLPIVKNGLQHYLKIDADLSMDVDLKHERMAFWKLLMISYFKVWKV